MKPCLANARVLFLRLLVVSQEVFKVSLGFDPFTLAELDGPQPVLRVDRARTSQIRKGRLQGDLGLVEALVRGVAFTQQVIDACDPGLGFGCSREGPGLFETGDGLGEFFQLEEGVAFLVSGAQPLGVPGLDRLYSPGPGYGLLPVILAEEQVRDRRDSAGLMDAGREVAGRGDQSRLRFLFFAAIEEALGMQQCESSAFDLAVELRFIDQLEEFANSLVVLLESELAEAQSITGQLSLGVGGIAGDEALVVRGSDRIQLAVIGRVRREIELERRVSGFILGRQMGDR